MQPELSILAILQLQGIGRRLGIKIVQAVPKPLTTEAELYDRLDEARSQVPRLRAFSRDEVEAAQTKALGIFEATQRQGFKIVALGTKDMPAQLASIPDPPLLLYVRGAPECLSDNAPVAIVGTRKPSDFGVRAAERFGRRLAESKQTVVGGLALGCDTAAHQGCLAANGKTAAVLAHGLDSVYPATNRTLADEIVERGGCLLSEYAPGTRPRSSYFVERDRLQSGLSYGVLVVETTATGGTMHTAKHCLAQGRLLACMVHPEEAQDQAVGDGNRVLLEQHEAFPIKDIDALIGFLNRVRTRYESTRTRSNDVPFSEVEARSENSRQRCETDGFGADL